MQDQRSRNIFDLKPTPTNFCPPDLATKAMSSVPAKMLSFTAEFEEDLAHEQLKKTQQCKEGVAWKSAGRVLAMPIAADGITMADITKIVSRAPNSFFMWVPWILVLIAVILLLLFFTTHTQGEFGSNVLVKGQWFMKMDRGRVNKVIYHSVEINLKTGFASVQLFVLAVIRVILMEMINRKVREMSGVKFLLKKSTDQRHQKKCGYSYSQGLLDWELRKQLSTEYHFATKSEFLEACMSYQEEAKLTMDQVMVDAKKLKTLIKVGCKWQPKAIEAKVGPVREAERGVISQELQDSLEASMDKSQEDMQAFIDQQLEQLEELKQEKLNLDTAREQFDRSRKHLDDADAAWTATCFALATEFLGFTRQIMDSLERLVANDLPPEEAAELKLFRMVNVCVRKRAEGGETSSLALDLLKQVMAAMKTGKRPPKMPREWADDADSEDAAEEVREQSDKLWDLMRAQADVAVKNNHWTKRAPPLFFLVFALPLPLYYVVDWLWRKWRAHKPEPATDAKKEKPSPKETKKQK
ncbi:unnamed protein product [Symbiodinium necroappetens]|uniref:Uncharacterized protein n=1 Tax=Symbiodinium necroappetens TaxID=1628268 RepID=A0A813A5J3_9DINO|nr:unnamed protein product [Symbiodinium necroappetens]